MEVPVVAAEKHSTIRDGKRLVWYTGVQMEHDLLKKAIEFTSKRNATSLPSSITTKKTTR